MHCSIPKGLVHMATEVTGLVLTKDGERHLARCLQSLDFCGRILVVDSESTDRTREIAREQGAEVLVRPWSGPLPQFRYALEQITTEWVVSLDQDEWLSAALREDMQRLFADQQRLASQAGFWCTRRSFYFDRYLAHCGWYPDRLLRVFHKGRMEVRASGPHYSFKPTMATGRLVGDIVHHPYEGLQEHVAKINYYTQEAARSLHARGRKSGMCTALAHGVARFAKIYLLRLGFLDGRAGLVLALHGFFYAFHKYLRVVELELADKRNARDPLS